MGKKHEISIDGKSVDSKLANGIFNEAIKLMDENLLLKMKIKDLNSELLIEQEKNIELNNQIDRLKHSISYIATQFSLYKENKENE